MRILRLDLDGGEELDLHPYVTVLGGLDPETHRRVVDRLVQAARDDAPHADVLVRIDQLPGARVTRPAAGPGDDALAAARTALAEVEAELAAAARAVATATNQLDEARRGVDDFAINAHDAAVSAVRDAEAGALARLQGAAASEQQLALESELAEAREAAARHEARLDAERLALLELLEELEQAQLELEALVGPAAADDPSPAPEPEVPVAPPVEDVRAIEQALELVRMGPPPAPMVASPEAAELADRIKEHNERHDALEQDLREEGIDVVALRDELAEAKAEVARAEDAARPTSVSPEDDAEIERLHDLVVSLGEKRGSRRAGKAAEAAYQEACGSLDAVLERVGFPTYAAYVMGRIAPTVDIDARRRLDVAVATVTELESRLDEAATILERDARVLMLRAERDQLLAAARDLLGTLPDDVEGALRGLRVPADTAHPAVDELRVLLDRLGIDRQGDDEPALVGAAETFLADAALARAEADERAAQAASVVEPDPAEPPEVVAARRVEDLHARAADADAALAAQERDAEALQQRVTEIEARLDELSAARPGDTRDDPRIAQDPTVAAAREQLAVAEARLARHRDAVALADELQGRLRDARRAEREVASRRDDIASEVDALAAAHGADTRGAEVQWHLDDAGVEPIEWFLLGRVASLRNAAASGSAPLILDDVFRGLSEDHVESLCAALAKVARDVQILYIGDEPSVGAWARAQGTEIAAVVRPGQPAH